MVCLVRRVFESEIALKILIYGINFAPELTGIGKYTSEMASSMAERGHDVRVVTAPPYYPAWAVGKGYSGWKWRRETWWGVDVWRCPLWVPGRPGGAKRLLHLATFALSSLPVMLWQITWRPDVVWVVEPPLFCAPTALAVAGVSGAKSWLHVQDYEVDAAFSLGLLKGDRLKNLVLGVERWVMRRFDVVSTISRRMLERAQAKGVAPKKLLWFRNWVDVGAVAQPSANGIDAYRAELGIPDGAVVALYSGNMGAKQGLEILAQVAHLSDAAADVVTPVWFVFCGDGVGRADLVAQCQGLKRVRFLDLQPAIRLPDLLALADIHLLPQRADAADLVMPSKLTGMLASGRAVVVTAHEGTELADVVIQCGRVVPPENAAALLEAINALAADPAERKRLGLAGLAYALSNLDRDRVLGVFSLQLRAVAAGRPLDGIPWKVE